MTDFIERISQQDLHRNLHQQQIDNLLIRIDLLKPKDRLMLEFHYRKNASFKQIASITGKKPQSIARYILSVTKRLLSQNYIMFLRYANCFNNRDLEIAYDKFLLGLGYRKIAARQKLSDKQARLKIEKLTSWLNKQILSSHRKVSKMNTNNPPVDFNHRQAESKIQNSSYPNHSDITGSHITDIQRTIQKGKSRNTNRISGNSFFGVSVSMPSTIGHNDESVKTGTETVKTGTVSVKTVADWRKAESGKTDGGWREALSGKVRIDVKIAKNVPELPRFAPEMHSFDPQMHPNDTEMHRF